MNITKLIINKNNRFNLGNITRLTLTPDKKIIMVIGTNGIGKSTLLSELTPLPANLKDYYDDGYKEIHIEHNNNYFELTSYKDTNKHSFSMNGEEHNRAGTKKVQLELVYKYFSLNPDIQAVMLNHKMFTHMSVSDRKKWFTNISDIDYNYPISVFDNLKKRARDIVGGIKILQSKLSKEESLVLSKDTIIKYNKDLDIYRLLLDNLLSSKVTINEHNRDIVKEFDTIVEYGNLLLKGLTVDSNLSNIEDDKYNYDKIETLDREIVEIKDKLEKSLILDNEIDTNIEAKLHKTTVELNEILNSVYITDMDNSNLRMLYSNFITLYPEISSRLSDLLEFDNFVMTISDYDRLNKEIDLLTGNKNELTVIIDVFNRKLLAYENLKKKKITCPKCENEFYDGYDSNEVKLLEDKVSLNTVKLDSLKLKLAKLLDTKSSYDKRENIISEINSMLYGNISICVYSEAFKDGLRGNMSKTMDKLFTLKEDLFKWQEIDTLREYKVKLTKELEILNLQKEIADKYILENRNQLEDKLHNLLNQKDSISNIIRENKVKRDKRDRLIRLSKDLKMLFNDKNKILKDNVGKLKNNTLNDMINYVKYEISILEKSLNDYNYVDKVITELKSEVVEYKEKEKILKLMIKEISPTDGLIAKSIKSFLSVFMEDMNDLINSVWSYELNVLPCKVEDGNDLDYKFPVDVDNSESLVPDIANVSSSMVEIINLAFRVISMRYLGLEQYPLYLDEFSKTMDPKHRLSVYDTIEKLSENSFNQIFIVSHFETMFARFKSNTDLVVLSPDNMMLDKSLTYNKILKLE